MNTISTEWIKIVALVALVGLNGWSQLRPAPAPAPAPVVAPVVAPDGPPSPPPVVAPDVKPSSGYLAFPEAGIYVVKVQIGPQQGAIIVNIDTPGSYPVALTA